MCLTAISDVQISSEDLKVYKFLYRERNDKFRSPFYPSTEWVEGETKEVNTFRDGDWNRRFVTKIPRYGVSIGYGFHSYLEKSTAVGGCTDLDAVVECTIPAGTPHILGDRGDVVSLKLRFDKVAE